MQTIRNISGKLVPVPFINLPARAYPDRNRDWHDSLRITDDDLRWSIYASKNLETIYVLVPRQPVIILQNLVYSISCNSEYKVQ